jgi:hypothetical protein
MLVKVTSRLQSGSNKVYEERHFFRRLTMSYLHTLKIRSSFGGKLDHQRD